MTQAPLIVWFRRDFRLSDHEALYAACETGRPIIPVFILDEVFDALGAAPKWRLGLAIEYFNKKLESMVSNLILRRGNASEILQELMNETGALDVYWSRAYDPASIHRDTKVKSLLNGVSFKGHVLFEPWVPKTKTGDNFKVYTPFWRHVSSQLCVNSTLPKISKLYSPVHWPISDVLSDWKLGEEMNRGKNVVSKYINVGEEAALNKLDHFISLNID